jgi:hypothetical protein
MQDILFGRVCDPETPARDVARCIGAWIDLEKLKREIRGIPPLAAAKLKELFDHMQRVKSLRRAGEPKAIEIVPAPAPPTSLPSISSTGRGASRIKTLEERMRDARIRGNCH